MDGIRVNNYSIVVTHIPGIKRPCLAIKNGCKLDRVAVFTGEEEAEYFKIVLDKMFSKLVVDIE